MKSLQNHYNQCFYLRQEIFSAAADGYDALVVPGGMGGVEALGADEGLLEALRRFAAADKWVAAICAGPQVLDNAGVLEGKRYTCYPGLEQEGIRSGEWVDEPVVADGKLVTEILVTVQ